MMPFLSDLRELARALGGEIVGNQVLAPGPGCSPRNRSMSILLSATSPVGFIAHSFRGQPWPELRDHICSRLGTSPNPSRRPRRPPQNRTIPAASADDGDAKRIGDALAIWEASVDPLHTPAEQYFASRKLMLDDVTAGAAIRWNGRIGAMVCLFRNIRTGEPQAISRTFLDADARKLERKFLGPTKGAAVMLDPFDSVTAGLHVGEGVETCLAARQLHLRPVWALGSTGTIAKLPLLSGVETLTLLAENDLASPRAVEECAARWHAAGREVLINRPIGGKDLNDAIKGDAV